MAIYTPFGTTLSIELILLALSIAIAAFHAHLIKEGETIVHWTWGAAYASIVLVVVFFFKLPWWFGAIQLCQHLAAFDWSLDLFRKLPLTYTSKTTTSVIDQLVGKYLFWVELTAAVVYVAAQFYIL